MQIKQKLEYSSWKIPYFFIKNTFDLELQILNEIKKKLPDVFIGKISAKNKNMKGTIKLLNLIFFTYFK